MPYDTTKIYKVHVSRVVEVAGIKLRPMYEYELKGALLESIEDAIATATPIG